MLTTQIEGVERYQSCLWPRQKFIPETQFLGKLCIRLHDYGDGFSRRRKSNGVCLDCKVESDKRYGRSESRKEYEKQYRQNNKDKSREGTRRYRERNPNKRKEYYQANREKIAARSKKFKEANRERLNAIERERYRKWRESQSRLERSTGKIRIYEQTPSGRAIRQRTANKSRALKRNAHSYPWTNQEWLDRIEQFESCCAYCGKSGEMTMEHFIPISLGGDHTLSNVIPACCNCNSSKGNKDPLEWFENQSFYSLKKWKSILRVLGKKLGQHTQLSLF